jgi:DNA topoisomerase-3
VNPEPLGKCRCCENGQVFETENAYVCDQHHSKNCAFRMGKMILKKHISRSEAIRILADGKTGLIPGFVSARTGRAFKAFLVLDAKGKVGFEFAPRAEKKPSKASTKNSESTSA